jgi:2-keto-4-pentenoate hydratase
LENSTCSLPAGVEGDGLQNLALLLSDDLSNGNTSIEEVLNDADLGAVTLGLELPRGRFFNASAAVK